VCGGGPFLPYEAQGRGDGVLGCGHHVHHHLLCDVMHLCNKITLLGFSVNAYFSDKIPIMAHIKFIQEILKFDLLIPFLNFFVHYHALGIFTILRNHELLL